MSDAELCLIEKENEKGDEGTSKVNESSSLDGTRDELVEI